MSLKTLMFLSSSLATAGMVVGPLAAQADGMSQLGTWGKPAGMGAGVSNLTCDGVPGIGSMNIRQMNLPRTPGVNTNSSAFWPAPSLGDTLLSYSSQPFEVDRAFVSDCRMPSDGIVEAFYIVEDVGLRLVA